jgi:hypothetical protein
MKHVLLLSAVMVLSSACSHFSAKPEVVYHRADLGEVQNKVVVFPALNFMGVKSKGSEEINRSVLSNWTQLYGTDKVIPAGPVADKISKANPRFYTHLISSFDNVSAIEQMGRNPEFKKVVTKITNELGNHHLAFSIIDGDSTTFAEGKPVRIHFGLFDTKNLTWKWITKVEDKKGMLSKWEVSSSAMISNSFEKAKSLRAPASAKE